MKRFLIVLLILCPIVNFAQTDEEDVGWWNDLHNWDGQTHWYNYLKILPATMGPNALPVPKIQNGKVPKNSYLDVSVELHSSPGDKTQNIYADLYTTLFSDRVGLQLSMVPVEHYKTDIATRNERASREFNPEGYSVGDLYLGTYIQLIRDRKIFPDVLITINLKTASGSNRSGARFTDTPGYYFDMSLGKTLQTGNSFLKSIRASFMGGLYVYQTNRSDFPQNDAVLYGVSLEFNFNKATFSNSFGGYSGYFDWGDKPVVYRAEINTQLGKMIDYKLGFQQGFRDFDYSTFRIGLSFNLDKVVASMKKKTD